MSRKDYDEFSKTMKDQVADIIISFNFFESTLKTLIANYIKGENSEFVKEIVLHNSIISFNGKHSLLQYIVKAEKIDFDAWESIHRLLTIRNAVAHSDNLLNYDGDYLGEEIVDFEFGTALPIFEYYTDGPKVTMLKNGKINSKGFDKIYKEFKENLLVVNQKLKKLNALIK